MFALVDCNNFYASCERVFNPSLIGRPVVILSNNDGCVIARSNEAKAIGVAMGAVAFQIKELIEKHKIAVFSSNYTLYGDMSARVMIELQNFSPNVEIYSIDEAFLDFSGFSELENYGKNIKKIVTRNTGIPISIGIAPTKALAKVANKIAKKNPALGGVFVLDSDEKIKEALQETKIEDVWGIGRKYAKFLYEHSVFTAYDFVNLHDGFVQKHLKIVGLRLKKELLGESCIKLEVMQPDKKAICVSRSFGEMVKDIETLEEAVATFAARCAFKLRRQKSAAGHLMVFIYTNPFNKFDPQYCKNILIQLPIASNSSIEIIKSAMLGLRKIFKDGYKYKKAGVIVSNLMPELNIQTALFEISTLEKHKKIMTEIDGLNLEYGREKVKIATQGTGRKWRLRQEKLSKCYTTKLDEIIQIGR